MKNNTTKYIIAVTNTKTGRTHMAKGGEWALYATAQRHLNMMSQSNRYTRQIVEVPKHFYERLINIYLNEDAITRAEILKDYTAQ